MNANIFQMLAHNPGGSAWIRLPLLVLICFPVPFLMIAVILIIKRKNLLALFSILAAVAAGIFALKLFADSVT
ncbi:MAG: hypothetical protein EHM48_02290 [Planctomycetaceae bacterium]|nr:MAG: hypothetical protein EHM48_02290 [Planctomycetaceae bacterium]